MGRSRGAWLPGGLVSLLVVMAAVGLSVTPGAPAGALPPGPTPWGHGAPGAPGSAAEQPIGVVTNLGVGVTRPGSITTGPDGSLWFVNARAADGVGGWLSHVTVGGAFTHLPAAPVPLGGGLAVGPDGNLWATGVGAIVRVTPAGVTTTFADPDIGIARGIVTGPDGALWFADETTHAIGRITTSGALTRFEDAAIVAPTEIVAGGDGALWFNSRTAATIGRITPAGAVTTVDGAVAGAHMTAGPDGRPWFAGAAMVGRVTDAGIDTVPTALLGFGNTNYGPLAVGSDGNLWVGVTSALVVSPLLRITPDEVVTSFTPEKLGTLVDMTSGPDGAVWFTTQDNLIGSIAPDGTVAIHRGSWVNGPDGITASPDGDLVFANRTGRSIGRVSTAGALSHIYDPTILPQRRTRMLTFATQNSGDLDVADDGGIWFVGPGELRRRPPGGGAIEQADNYYFVQHVAIAPSGYAWATSNESEPSDLCLCRNEDHLVRVVGEDAYVYAPQGWWQPGPITAGPDGNMWFIASRFPGPAMALVKATPDVAQTVLPVDGVASIDDLTPGPDGNMWFTAGDGHAVGRMTPAGVTTLFPTGSLSPRAITVGPDGNLWFTSAPGGAIGRITPQGAVASVTDPTIDDATSITAGPDGGLWFTNRGNNSIGRLTLPPAAPSAVVAVPGTTAARVTWAAPATGGSPITRYTVTAAPGGSTCTSDGSLTCTVRGLPAGVAHTFTVTATNVAGTSPPSPPTVAVTPGRGGGYHALAPARILDSRTATGSWSGALAAGAPRELQLVGAATPSPVPDTASAVVMNVTATDGSEGSFLTVWAAGTAQPTSSNLNFAAGETIPNLVTAPVGTDGRVAFANAHGAVHVVADVVGYYDDGTVEGDRFTGIAPVRLLDSRTEVGGWDRPLVAARPRDLLVRQPGNPSGVPRGATTAVLNVTATDASTASFLAVRPSAAPAGASNLNFAAGQTIANLVMVKIGSDGAITLDNSVGEVEVIVDLMGYFDPTAGSRFHGIDPTRVLDDRIGTGLSGPWGPNETRTLAVAGVQGSPLPADATSVIANVTATGGTAASFVTVFPNGASRPNSSNLNFGSGQTIPNLVMVGIEPGGGVDLFNAHGSVDLVADAVGYFAPV